MFDENSIVDRVLSGDDSAFDRLVDRYEHKVYQYALRFLGQESDACQATEQSFCEIYRKLNTRTDTQLSTWIFRIVANKCADLQHHKRGVPFTDAVTRLREPFARDGEHDLSEEIQIQLLHLTRQQREVLLLRDLCGLNDEETGLVLQLDERGVRSRLSRARKNLRDLLLRQNVLEKSGSRRQRYNSSKDCENFRELCSQYVDECIDDADKTALLDHIQECDACASYLNDLTTIGRALSHMEETELPEDLREKIDAEIRRQAEEVQISRRRRSSVPAIALVSAAVVVALLVCSGVLGGMFVNSSSVNVESAESTDAGQSTESMIKDIDVPDVVAESSYAFVIGASGDTDLPELSSSATLLASDTEGGVEFYAVDNDVYLAKKLIEGLESVGYEIETITSEQIVISSSATQGLFIVIHQ